MRTTPDACRRDFDCQPLHAIVSSDNKSWMCCGLHGDKMEHSEDVYRLCFVNTETDTRYEHDEYDLLDLVEVISRGMSTKRRLEAEP